MARIRKLPDDVIQRIAAGEILLRPVNAVKELIENSVDAGATEIFIMISEGGLKGLQVSDNGHGIAEEDLALLCQRHATSKLHALEDLESINTFGFRGEALASMSAVGRITVLTNTDQQESLGFRAFYSQNRLQGRVERQSRSVGTTIIIDDLFYAFPERRKLFLSRAGEEYRRVFDLVCKCAVSFHSKVGFTLRRGDKNVPDVQTNASMSIKDILLNIHGSELAENHCVWEKKGHVLKCRDDSEIPVSLFLVHSNAQYRRKEASVTIFINGRLVEWTNLVRNVRAIYSKVILSGWEPWVSINLTLPPQRLDVNISPTKHSVTVLDDDEVMAWLMGVLENSLTNSIQARQLQVSSPRVPFEYTVFPTVNSTQKEAPYKRVYSDYRATTIDQFFSSPKSSTSLELMTHNVRSSPVKKFQKTAVRLFSDEEENSNLIQLQSPTAALVATIPKNDLPIQVPPWELVSFRKLRDLLLSEKSAEVSMVIKKHSMVGVDREGKRTFIQYETNLLMTDTVAFAMHLFYSTLIHEVGRLRRAHLTSPMSVYELIMNAFSCQKVNPPEAVSKEKIALEICELMAAKRNILADYFSVEFSEDGKTLLAVPWMIDEPAIPRKDLLGVFLFRLAVEVDWDSEEEQLIMDAICREIAVIYSQLPYEAQDNGEYIKNRLYPALKASRYGFPSKLAQNGSILLVTNMHELYKKVDRC